MCNGGLGSGGSCRESVVMLFAALEISMSFWTESTGMLQVSGPDFQGTSFRKSVAVPGAVFNINSSKSTKHKETLCMWTETTRSCPSVYN